MGLPMAARLLAAGFPVQAWNRSPQAGMQLRERLTPGARRLLTVAASVAEAVHEADVVITMLSDGPAVRAVLFPARCGTGAAAGSSTDAGGGADLADPATHNLDTDNPDTDNPDTHNPPATLLSPGSVLVDMSSIPPQMAREHAQWLAAAGAEAIDAPVSGGVVGAQAGTLAIMAGGSVEVLTRLQPVLAVLGRVTPVGPAGAGQLAKLANQVIVGITIGAVAEALLLAAQGGADPRAVRDAIRGGFAESRILELHGARMLDEAFVPGGAVHTQVKDLQTALAAAEAAGLTLPITGLLAGMFAAAATHGDGGLDHSALLRQLARQNQLPTARVLAMKAEPKPGC